MIRDQRYFLVFDGRIDNRAELFAQINLLEDESLSDAQLLLLCLIAKHESIFNEIIGPFSFVFMDKDSGTVLAARVQGHGNENMVMRGRFVTVI